MSLFLLSFSYDIPDFMREDATFLILSLLISDLGFQFFFSPSFNSQTFQILFFVFIVLCVLFFPLFSPQTFPFGDDGIFRMDLSFHTRWYFRKREEVNSTKDICSKNSLYFGKYLCNLLVDPKLIHKKWDFYDTIQGLRGMEVEHEESSQIFGIFSP